MTTTYTHIGLHQMMGVPIDVMSNIQTPHDSK